MSRADFLLYRRMRGIFWGLLVGGVVLVPVLLVVGFGIAVNIDATPADVRRDVGPAGALMSVGIGIGGFIALIAAVVLGATAGSIDFQRGVLRDLVLTGRTRWRIVVGRLVAAAGWLVLAMLVSFGACAALGVLLSPSDQPVDWEELARLVGTFGYSLLYTMPFAAGVALFVGSRGPAIAVFFAVAFVLDGVLGAIPKVSEWWEHVSLLQSSTIVDELIAEPSAQLDGDAWKAIAVVAGWAIVPFVGGIIRLTRRDL